MKTTIKERIRLALDRSGKSISDLARHMKLAQPSVSGVLNREGELDSIKYLEATEAITGYSFEWLRTGNEPVKVLRDNNGTIIAVADPPVEYIIPRPSGEVVELRDENERLKFEIEILRSALREIGSGRETEKSK